MSSPRYMTKIHYQRSWTQYPWYPLLFVLYPVLNLYAANVGWVKFQWVLPALAVSLIGTGLILLVTSSLVRSITRGALITLLILFLFFSYGHVFAAFERVASTTGLSSYITGRNRFLIPLWGLSLFVGMVAASLIPKRRLVSVIPLLNFSAITIVVLPLLILGVHGVSNRENGELRLSRTQLQLPTRPAPQMPNIYLIILDGYARNDVLQRCYGYDNSDFTDWLSNLGFIVPTSSRSNYSQTILSLGSMLNMEYFDVDDAAYRDLPTGTVHSQLAYNIQQNRVEQALKTAGYRLVRIASPWTPTSGSQFADDNYNLGVVHASLTFNDKLLSTTILRLFNLRSGEQLGAVSWLETSTSILRFFGLRGAQHDFLEFTFWKLAELSGTREPSFIFAHIVSPHPPYLFDSYGEPYIPDDSGSSVSEWHDKRGYLEQVRYLNHELKTLVRTIIDNSRVKPIILLQADHGAHGSVCTPEGETSDEYVRTAVSNFSAYYIPEVSPDEVYNTITPVNLFRLIFREYFGASIELYDDKSYYSSQESPFGFVRIP